MFITNTDDLIDKLHPKLQDYLVMKMGDIAKKKKFPCYVHEDNTPSMAYNPKDGNTTVHCFGCGVTHNIFSAAAHFDGLPSSGPEWVTQTLPALAEMFGIQVQLGDISPVDKERLRLYKLFTDISNILSNAPSTPLKEQYLAKRGWSDEKLIIANCSKEYVVSRLEELGWATTSLVPILMLTHPTGLIGEDLITFVIKDYRNRPVALAARNLGKTGPKYVNSPESIIYEKRKILFGLEHAIALAKKEGLYLVEGQGDVASMHKQGIYNVAGVCGCAFTSEHFSLLKMLGIKRLFFSLDWDAAGKAALRKILKDELRQAIGLSCSVVMPPDFEAKDVGDLFLAEPNPDAFYNLKVMPAFDWVVQEAADNTSPEELCEEMIPIIASEQAAVRRETLIKTLSDLTFISIESIREDVQSIRDNKTKERNERIKAASEKYQKDVASDPSNAQSILGQHQDDLLSIEKDYNKKSTGAAYQLSRFDALEDAKMKPDENGHLRTEFVMNTYTFFAQAFADGMSWTEGVLVYFGGRGNSGKTGTVIALGLDVALSDPEAIVVMHFTDDTYAQVEPRLKSNIASMLRGDTDPILTIGSAASPLRRIQSQNVWDVYQRANETFRELLAQDKLVILDSEDGSTLSVLDRNLKMIRAKYPDKKLLVVCDNTHNYQDYPNLAQTERMTRISDGQKHITGKYRCAMFATAEYRKNAPIDPKEIRLPVDDDLADARALIYRPNAIIHVYQDLHDRKDYASIYWQKPGDPQFYPRLMLVFSKNKISGFKDKLILDLDKDTVSLKQVDADRARFESQMHEKRQEMKKADNDEMDELA